MATDFQARVASEVLWQEDKLLQYQYGEHAREQGPSQSRLQVVLGSLFRADAPRISVERAKYAFTNNCYLPMRMALEAAKKAAEWELETKDFKQTFKIVTTSGEAYVEAIIDPQGRRRLIGPFRNEHKAEEWIETYGAERLTPDIVEFARDALSETSWR